MNRLKFVLMAVVACALFAGFSTPAFAQKQKQGKSKEEIEAQIRALEQKKQAEQAKRATAA